MSFRKTFIAARRALAEQGYPLSEGVPSLYKEPVVIRKSGGKQVTTWKKLPLKHVSADVVVTSTMVTGFGTRYEAMLVKGELAMPMDLTAMSQPDFSKLLD